MADFPGNPNGNYPRRQVDIATSGQPGQFGQTGQAGMPMIAPQGYDPSRGPQTGQTGQTGQTVDRTHPISQGERFQLAAGTTLQNGRYVVEDVVGQGGMGHVYKVYDTHLNVRRALKEMIPHIGGPEAELINFRREAQMLLDQEHPGIPQIFDSFIEYRRAYIVLQFIPGDNLERRLKATTGFLSQDEVGGWMLQLCQIVGHLHSQHPPIIFRDIKPSNIVLTPDGRIVLVDFGIAKTFVPSEEHTNVGTNGYAPPEQYRRQAEPRSDIYAIGATMHHLLTRDDPRKQPPFTFQERLPRRLNSGISEAMEAVMMKCLERNVDARYRTCEELSRAIESALGLAPQDDTGYVRTARSPRGTWGPALGPTSTLRSGAQPLWSFQTEDEVRSTPTVGSEMVYIGSYDNNLYALDRRSGARRWQFPTEGGICSRPALVGNNIIFGSEDFNVYALDARTGAEVWRHRTWGHVRSSPCVAKDIVYIGSDDGHLYALDARDGQMIWRYQTYREVQSSAAFVDNLVLFGSRDNYLYGVDATSGEKKWSFRSNGPILSAPAARDGFVYFGSFDFSIYCLEARSGWRAWEERTEKFVLSSPTIAGDLVYVGSSDGHLYCLNRKTGRRLWRYHANNQVNCAPAVANGSVFFGSIDRSVYALDAEEGRLQWRFETDGMVPGSPVVADGVVYVGSADHRLYALPASN